MNTFRTYLQEIGRYPLLTAEEEIRLGTAIKGGTPEESARAREQLINSNLRLVVNVAKKYTNSHLSIADLVSEGNLGLITAVDKYNPALGYRFSTCAVPWIKQSILKALVDKGTIIRLPAHIYQQMNKMRDAIETLEHEGIMDPTDEQIAEKCGLDAERVQDLKNWRKDAISLDTPLNDEEKNTLEDLVPDTEDDSPVKYTERELFKETMMAIIHEYPDRVLTILKMRFGLAEENDPVEFETEHTLEQIGAYLGITRERVRQILKSTLDDIRTKHGSKLESLYDSLN